MRVAMIGTGYVGLVSGACFSQFGHNVTCVDSDKDKIARLERGEIPIFEPGLDKIVPEGVRDGRLSFTTKFAEAVKNADAVFIAVGTPSRGGEGSADLTYVRNAAKEIAGALDGYTIIVTKSTVPVGTGSEVEEIIREARPDAEFDVVSNPEFLREGSAIEDFMRPDRVVVGTGSLRAQAAMRELYRPLYINETPILFTSRETSELIKYAGNAFLATKITFINEMADICEAVGADVQDVARGIGLDNRIGKKFLHAGPGYGGSCFPKDTLALARTAQDRGSPTLIVEAVIKVNEERKKRMAQKIIEAAGGSVKGKTIGILGLTFKPNTDDMRDSPSLDIIPILQKNGATIHAFDPAGMEEASKLLDNINYCTDAYQVAAGSDVIVLLTEWNEFRALDMNRIKANRASTIMVDLRNVYRPEDMAEKGITYHSVGRAFIPPEGS